MSLKPQPGFQTKVLATPADIAIIGGGAGGGKSFCLLAEASRHTRNPEFGFVAFRRTTTQIRAQGGLWDESVKMYLPINGKPKESYLEWQFPSGAKGKFAHMEHEKNVYDWQGSQIPLILFDELTHFTEVQFWYMVSRNRSNCGVKPYIRASCNPDPNSWVAKLIEWYIDQTTGFPIPERAGVVRYFTRDGEVLVWGDTKQEVIDACPHIFKNEALVETGVALDDLVKSFTFIPGNIYENKLFIKSDPGYLGNLLSLQPEEKQRLLEGNWKVSLDGLLIPTWEGIENLFSNYPEEGRNAGRFITCDAARFGRDFCVIYVWKGWEVVHVVIIRKSEASDIVRIIEGLRRRFSVVRSNVLIDQDGVGDGAVKMGNYKGFHGGAQALKDQESRILERYENLITQVYYRFSLLRVNTGQVRFSITNENVEYYEAGDLNPIRTTKIKIGGVVKDVRELIKEDFRVVKRVEGKNDGVEKIKMIAKEEKKNILKRSPDFGDAAVMREYFELIPKAKEIHQQN